MTAGLISDLDENSKQMRVYKMKVAPGLASSGADMLSFGVDNLGASKADVLLEKSRACSKQGQQKLALQYGLEAIEEYKKGAKLGSRRDSTQLDWCNIQLAECYCRLNDYKKASEYMNKKTSLITNRNYYSTRAMVNTGLGLTEQADADRREFDRLSREFVQTEADEKAIIKDTLKSATSETSRLLDHKKKK